MTAPSIKIRIFILTNLLSLFTKLICLCVYFQPSKSSKTTHYFSGREENKALHAAQVISNGLGKSSAIGRRSVIEEKLKNGTFGKSVWMLKSCSNESNGISYQERLQTGIRKHLNVKTLHLQSQNVSYVPNTTVLASTLLSLGYADTLVCGLFGSYRKHLASIRDIIGLKDRVKTAVQP